MTDPFAELKALRDGTGFWATDIDEMAMNLEITYEFLENAKEPEAYILYRINNPPTPQRATNTPAHEPDPR